MATKKKSGSRSETIEQPRQIVVSKVPATKMRKNRSAPCECDDCCALNAHAIWGFVNLIPAWNGAINFSVPAGKRYVIESITATINVPDGENVRLRLATGIGIHTSNMDLVVIPQGVVLGQAVFVATHALKAYADSLLRIFIARDNPNTKGYAFACFSGYLIDL